MAGKRQLLVFSRYPEAGRSKTRLISALGAEGAARLQRRLSDRVLALAPTLARELGVETVALISGGQDREIAAWLPNLPWRRQSGGDLGRRMRTAFVQAFRGGAEQVVLVGTDIPDLSLAVLGTAFAALADGQAALGPSRDGGYYLLGLPGRPAPGLLRRLFTGIPWSTPMVGPLTLSRLHHGGAVTLLPTLTDIDLPGQLPLARARGLL